MASTIARIEITHHRMPLTPAFRASWDGRPRDQFEATIVRVTDSEGRVGVGSGDLMLGFAGHEDLFLGRDPMDHDAHYTTLDHIQFHYGRCWPMDLALWDLAGKIAGKPVWEMLGGQGGRVRLYASSGVLRDTGAMVAQAERFADEGFAGMKIRLTSTDTGRAGWRADLEVIEAIRARLGDRLALMVDCNQGWRMPWDQRAPWQFDDALEVARALEALDVYWMEEPLHRADRAGMAALRAATEIRIAGGEMTREASAFDDLIADHALDILQPDAALVGGITGCARIARSAQAKGLAFTPHSWTNGIGVLANAHLFAGVQGGPWLEWPYDPPDWDAPHRDFMLAHPPTARNGWLDLGSAPGLGITLNEETLAATRIG